MENFALSIIMLETPFLLVYLIGLILAIMRRKQHPNISLLAAIYFSGKIILSIINLGAAILPMYYVQQGNSIHEIGTILGIINLISNVVGTILSVILLFAIFGWRNEKKTAAVVE
jgi:hypothetical protein